MLGGPPVPYEMKVNRGHFVAATEPPKDAFEARRRGKNAQPTVKEAAWVIKAPNLGISINDQGFVKKVAHGSEVENKLFEGDRTRSINGTKVASKQQAYALMESVEPGGELTLAVNIEQREVRCKLAYVDFLPEEEEGTLDELLHRVNKELDAWKIKVLSVETMMIAGSIANKDSTFFRLGMNEDKAGNKSFGGRGAFYQFFRVWYNAADPANRIPEVVQKNAALKEAADQAQISLNETEGKGCAVM